MKQEEWAQRLESHLKGYRKSPHRDLWEGIEASLDKQPSLDGQPSLDEQVQHPSRIASLRRWVVAAILAGLIFGGSWLLWPHLIGPDTKITAEATIQQPHPAMDQASPMTISSEQPFPPSEQPSSSEPPQKSLPPEIGCSISCTQLSPTFVGRFACQTPSASGSALDKLNALQPHEKTEHHIEHSTSEALPSEALPSETLPSEAPLLSEAPRPDGISSPSVVVQYSQAVPEKISLSLFASSGAGTLSSRNGVMMNPALIHPLATRGEQPYLVGYEERQSHSQPVAFGLTLSYHLSARLALSTGAVYTKLSADFHTLMPHHQIHRHQALHYVGIPLSLQLRLWQWRGLSAYVSAGGQVDWNVKAHTNTDGVDQETSKDRAQWSVGGSLGLQYNPLPQLGIYAEPGLRHYLNNGSSVSTFFKDKPTSFSLQLGLRVTLEK